jgi:putative endopeptidase
LTVTVPTHDPVFAVEDMDPGTDPGVDFYRFANGGWLDRNPVPPEYPAWGSINEVQVRNEDILHGILETAATDPGETGTPQRWVGDFYASGMDTDQIEAVGLEPLQPWFDRIEALSDIDDLRALTAELHGSGIGLLFGMGVSPDFEDSSRHLLYLGQGGLGLPDRDYYLRDDEESQRLRALYREHVTAMLTLLGQPVGAAGEAAAAILELETAMAEPSFTNVQLRDVDLVTNKVSADVAAGLMPHFDLPAYFELVGIETPEHLNVTDPDFFTAVDNLLQAIPLETWKSYVRWHLLRSTAPGLPEAFEDESFRFYGTILGGQQEQKVRWKRVLAAGTGEIGQLVSRLYVDVAFSPESKRQIEELVERLFAAMDASIHTVEWMSDETRAEALAKLAGFTYKIGYPDEWRDYRGLELGRGPWVTNRLAARRFEVERELGLLDEPVDPHEWEMPPHVVNAYYHPLRNEIVFPAGILQPPFFAADADHAVNYGAIGTVIGHEITHGFDDQGSRFDAAGTLRNWWTDDDRAEFDTRAAVVIDQFNGYQVEEGLNVNGELTVGENIADLGGLTLSHAALQSALEGEDRGDIGGLTPEQRFYVSYARVWRQSYTDEYLRLLVNTNPHSPSRFRCLGPLGNLDEFAVAFGLGPDAPMMRPVEERAKVW